MPTIEAIERRVVACRKCPELRVVLRRGRPRQEARLSRPGLLVAAGPRLGRPAARIVLVGLAPGAHGSNRTGRVFTGDGSGEWLFRALHRAGFASQPNASHRDDGLTLRDAFITAAVRCAPPANKPTPEQRANCAPYLREEFAALGDVRVVVTLGKIADDAVHALVKETGRYGGPRAPFAHLAETRVELAGRAGVTVLASYHPSRQNTKPAC